MKLTRSILVILLAVTVTLISCKSKTAKELVVNKWKITEMSGKGVADMPDSAKARIYRDATMEFLKDGKFITSGMDNEAKTGTYSISDDGKTMISTNDDDVNTSVNSDTSQIPSIGSDKQHIRTSYSDTLNILEISANKLVVEDKKGNVKVVFHPK